ncbi:MAG: Ig-like domain-containing protein [Erysipelotrichaceae bacterium]|nr:Ig-like domain-containing protein [Erysipelotrichaceae bacterium]
MRPASSTKRLACTVLTWILAVSLTGCRKQITDGILMSEWISLINEEAGIQSYRQKEPYYLNITPEDRCFGAVQAAVEWEILDPSVAFEPDDMLSREWMAYTLMNLSGRTDNISGTYAADLNQSRFPDAVNNAIAAGLLKTDSRSLFHPKDIAAKEEAEQALKTVIGFINHREIGKPEFELVPKEDIPMKEIEADDIDEDTLTARIPEAATGDYVYCRREGGQEIYQVESIEDDTAKLIVPDAMAVVEEIHASGSQTVSFEDALILGPNGEILNEPQFEDTEHARFRNMSARGLLQQYKVNDWVISLRASGGSITAHAEKQLAHGGIVSSEVGLSGLQVDYDWNSDQGILDNAYFRASFHTDENFAVQGTEEKFLYGDFSRLDPASFLSSISSFYQEKKDVIDATFTLCRIRLPLPQAPYASIEADLQLNLMADGKAELSLGQDTVCGMEVRNGSIRMIKDFDHTKEALIRSSFHFATGIRIGLNMMNMCLCDLMCEAGAAGTASATVHLYDEDGKMQNASTDVDAYAADLMSDGNENAFVCADLDGNWILDLSANSKATALGKMGLSGEVHLLNQTNAPLIKGIGGHYENWQPVKECTYGDHRKGEESDHLRVSSNIVIENYAFSLASGESKELKVLAVPAGYSLNNLVYESDDPSVAAVSGSTVTALQSGSTTISVSTSDGKYRITCSVIVPQVNGDAADSD